MGGQRQRVCEVFSWDGCVNAYDELWRQLTDSRRSERNLNSPDQSIQLTKSCVFLWSEHLLATNRRRRGFSGTSTRSGCLRCEFAVVTPKSHPDLPDVEPHKGIPAHRFLFLNNLNRWNRSYRRDATESN
jgi:hypothetical protein